jgi:hypothetical protein
MEVPMDDEVKYKTGILSNPLFRQYIEGLPTIRRRILSLPDGGVIVTVQEGEQPPEVVRQAPENKDKKGEEN